MNELICVIAFIFGQFVFLPSYLKCTTLLTNEKKLNAKKQVEYIILSPLSAYVLSSIIYTLIGYKFPEIAVIGADVIMYIISLLYMMRYQHVIEKRGNKILGIYIYVAFFLFQTSFTYVFESVWFIVFNQIILTTVLSVVIYKITKRYIGVIEQKNLKLTTENEMMLMIPFSVTIIKLIQSVTYSVLVYNKTYSQEILERFSAYNEIINNIILLMIICVTGMMFHAIARQTQLISSSEKYKTLSEQSLRAMVHAIEAKDPYTKGHSIRVAKYSKMIAKKMGYSEADTENIYMMALVHDIGKIGISDKIINKPGKLTNDEYTDIKQHPLTGAKILQEVDVFGKMSEIALCHHERVDGKGYPRGLKGDEISEEVAIVSVADAYDAMTSCRNYRDIMSQEKVKEEIRKGIGTQFKEKPAEAMLEIIREDKQYNLHQKKDA